jgi:hypothetical protein
MEAKTAANDDVNDASDDSEESSSEDDTSEEWIPSNEKKRKAVAKKDAQAKGRKPRATKKSVKKIKEDTAKAAAQSDCDSDEKKPRATKKSAPANVKKWRAPQKAQIKEDTAEAVAESDYDSDETDDNNITDLASHMSELNFSACNTFGKALNSSDTHLGAELLTFATTFSEQVPNEQLCQKLLNLIMLGPKSEGTMFPDCHRMELANNYMSLLLSKPGFADKLSRVAKPSFWRDCLDQMTAPIYCVAGDEHRISAAAIERTGQSLHVKVCCAELFLALLSRELKGFVRKQHEPDTDSLNAKPIVANILARRRGAKEALEKSFKACTKLWSMYGHFILCDLPDLETAMDADDGPSDVSVHFVRSQASRLVQVMGKLCSYFAWLYGVKAHEGTSALVYLVNGSVPQDLEETTFDPAPFLDAADYSKEVKLSFLLNLDKRCVPQLKPLLAEMLGVATKYNAIFG